MNAPFPLPLPDPGPAHAVFAPSSAHRWMACTASAEAIACLPEQEEGEEAAEGTAAHEELERVMNGGAPDPDHDAAYIVALTCNYVKQLPPGQTWVEQRVHLTDQIWGRCDVAHWHPESLTLTIVDMKNGYVGVDAEENEQLQIYAAGSIYTHNLPARWVRLVVVQPNDFRPVPRVKQWVTDADSLFAFATKAALVPRGPKTFVAGSQCTYCPLFGKCEASKDVLANVGALVAGLMSPADVTLAQRALFTAMAKPIKDAFDNATKAWTKEALSGRIPADMKIVTSQKHKAWKDEAAARALVLERLGADALDLPSPAQAIERGIPEDVINAMAPRPEGAPVLAFANDKRPPFERKGIDKMFGSVPK
jgi:hypothetical protein